MCTQNAQNLFPILDAHVKSQKAPVIVIPANAGIQENKLLMDSRVRGSDGLGDFLRDHHSYSPAEKSCKPLSSYGKPKRSHAKKTYSLFATLKIPKNAIPLSGKPCLVDVCFSFDVRRSMFDVGCSSFSPPL